MFSLSVIWDGTSLANHISGVWLEPPSRPCPRVWLTDELLQLGSFLQVLSFCLKLSSWRATALHSLAPTHTFLGVSSDPEDLDYLDRVCLIRVGAKLSRAVALQELSLRPMS